MEAKIEELKKDEAELMAFAEQAVRPKVKSILTIEARKIDTEVMKLKEQVAASTTSQASNNKPISTTSNRRPQVTITGYGYDDEEEDIVFHVTIPNVHKVSVDNINCKLTAKGFELEATDVDNKDYIFKLKDLSDRIIPNESTWKLKKDRVEIKCVKAKEGYWTHVTEHDAKAHAAKQTKTDDVNASDGLFTLLKDMYDKGDDTMKQTLRKAWEESHMKQPKF